MLAQARDFGPDVVYVQNLQALRATLAALRAEAAASSGQIATAAAAGAAAALRPPGDVPSPLRRRASGRSGASGRLLRIGFDARVLDDLVRGARSGHGAVFVGALETGCGTGGGTAARSSGVAKRADRVLGLRLRGSGRPGPQSAAATTARRGGIDMFRLLHGADRS